MAPRRERTCKALRYGTRSQGISQFYLHTPRSSAIGMNHRPTCPSQSPLCGRYQVTTQLCKFNDRAAIVAHRKTIQHWSVN